MAGREFQRDGAMKLKERCPNDFRFRLGIFSSFSLEDGEIETVHKCRETKKDKEVKTLQRPYINSIRGTFSVYEHNMRIFGVIPFVKLQNGT